MTNLKVRKPAIQIKAISLRPDWLGGNGFLSQFLNSLSMLFPAGEGFFIHAVQSALPQVEDPELVETVGLFIGQEAVHSRLHLLLNQRLKDCGLFNLVEPLARWRIRHSQGLAVTSKLAITMAYEHFTALFGEMMFGHPEWLENAEQEMSDLWMWHAAEEMEHRAVAFDVYQAIGGGTVRRLSWFLYVSLVFLTDLFMQQLLNLIRTGLMWRGGTWAEAFHLLLGRQGVLWRLAPAWFDYLRPGYHPLQRGCDAEAKAWLQGKEGLFS